ncbi:SpoIIE family protein phosphatase [Telmatobacter sp. DSM 110680]|uniref:SpoIIE family protein phosphatase n=1 Tax=Telmatobacter sp. DSM 110680 TaxID=3036704 RepID=A0AAU7DJ73_9BACT
MSWRFASRLLRCLPLLAFLLPAFVVPCAHPQNFDASRLLQPASLGDVKWLVQAGDNPAYADPNFDDSHWQVFDPHKSIDALYPQLPAVVWYRLHIKVDPATSGLALSECLISQAFEIYVNGQRLMVLGSVSPWVAYTSNARVLVPIPDQMNAGGELVVAMRVHIGNVEWHGQQPGYSASNLSIGQEQTLYRDNWLTAIGANAMDWLDRGLVILLGFVALVLWMSQRQQTVYLWIFAVGALILFETPLPFVTTFHNMPVIWELFGSLPRLAAPFIWVSLYFAFVHQRVGWVWRIILLLTGIADFTAGLQGWFITLPVQLQALTGLPFVVLLSVVIPIVLIIHWRRGNREAGLLLVPVVLFSFYIYALVVFSTLFQSPAWRQTALRGLNLIDRLPAGPFSVSLHSLTGMLSTLTLSIIILRRSANISRRQAQLEGELAAAQEVQRVLVPEHTGAVPGFKVESAYVPAQQVGDDFFQILPDSEAGILIVVGDVAGKGLPAAMLVSVLVGAIRGVAEFTKDPAELLSNLNERLVGRAGGALSTALIARISADGQVTIANAGHLSPYLDGKEVELPGALPLGVASSAKYESTEFHMNIGSRLTFYSDGVIEAQKPGGELFGFDRAREVSMKSAAEIVETAKRFGQEDDITVVTVTRTAAVATAA